MCFDNFLIEMGKNLLIFNKLKFYFYFWKIIIVYFIILDLIYKENNVFLYVYFIRIFVDLLNVNYFLDILMKLINISCKFWFFIKLFLL